MSMPIPQVNSRFYVIAMPRKKCTLKFTLHNQRFAIDYAL